MRVRRRRLINSGPGGFDNTQSIPDAYELRLLLSQDFSAEHLEWAMNTFFEQEIGGDRGREWGIANSFLTPIRLGCPAPEPAPISDGKDFQGKNVKPVVGATAPNEDLKRSGLECQFRSFSDSGSRGKNRTTVLSSGLRRSWRATHGLRFDVSPLFGVNHKSPIAQVFVVVSYLFGAGGPRPVAKPLSFYTQPLGELPWPVRASEGRQISAVRGPAFAKASIFAKATT